MRGAPSAPRSEDGMDLLDMRVTLTNPGLTDRLRALAASLRRPEKALADFAGGKVRRIKESFVPAPKMDAAAEGQPPHVHRRDFSRSILHEVQASGGAVLIGSAHVGAQMLQEGGTIRPKNAKSLAVPLVEKAYGKRPRDFTGLHFVPVKAGKVRGFLIQETAGSKKHGFLEAGEKNTLFILLASVRVRKHPWLMWGPKDDELLGLAIEDQADREVGIER